MKTEEARKWLAVHRLDWPPCECGANKTYGFAEGTYIVICEECGVMAPQAIATALKYQESW